MKHKPFNRFLLATAILGVTSSAYAASGSWNVDTDTTWSTAGSWTSSTIADGETSVATFGNNITADRTVTLDSSRTIGGLTFDDSGASGDSNWILSSSGGSILTLDNTAGAGTGTATVNVTNTATINAQLAGGNLTKTGAGTLSLTGNNSYGNTTLSAGTLTAGSNTAFGTGTIALNAGTLSSNAAAGAGDRTFANAVTIGGNIALGNATNTGKLTFTNTVGFGSGTRTITMNSDAEFSGTLSNGTLHRAGTGKLTLSGTGSSLTRIRNTTGGDIDISGSVTSVDMATTASSGTSSINVLSGGSLTINGPTNNGTQIGAIGGHIGELNVSGTFTQNSGLFWLATNTNSTGTLNLNSGKVTFSTGMNASSGAGTGSADGIVLGRNASGTGTINLNGGTLEVGQNIIRGAGIGNFNFDGGTLKTLAASSLSVSNTTVKTDGAIVDTTGGDFAITTSLVHDSGLGVTPDGGLTKKGGGILTINGTNTFTGATDIQAGTLKLASGSTIANTSSITVGSTATLDATSASLTLGGSQTLQGKGQVTGTVITGANTSTIAPGGASSSGTLTLATLNAASGSTFNFELGTASDLLAIGALTGSTAAGDLKFNLTGVTGIATSTAYTLFTFTSQSGFDETDLAALTLPTGLSLDPSFGVGGWNIDDTNNTLQVQFIPEPTSALLGGLGLLALLRRRRA